MQRNCGSWTGHEEVLLGAPAQPQPGTRWDSPSRDNPTGPGTAPRHRLRVPLRPLQLAWSDPRCRTALSPVLLRSVSSPTAHPVLLQVSMPPHPIPTCLPRSAAAGAGKARPAHAQSAKRRRTAGTAHAQYTKRREEDCPAHAQSVRRQAAGPAHAQSAPRCSRCRRAFPSFSVRGSPCSLRIPHPHVPLSPRRPSHSPPAASASVPNTRFSR